jgi:uncharacterized protein YecE (DUF72 family)
VSAAGRIRVGVGGWTFAPWRGSFYPPDLPHARELAFASEKLTTLEINGTFYRTQTPATFRKWRDETPADFVFSVKAHRYATSRPKLAEAGAAIAHFLGSGVTELGAKLGPILWQLPPFRKFEAADVESFLALLPRKANGLTLRHALEVRHKSFRDAAFVALARSHDVAIALIEAEDRLPIADITADFVYARLECARAEEPAGYSASAVARWAERFSVLATGAAPPDLERIDTTPIPVRPRDCFVFFISGAKERNPAAALALLERLRR